MVSQCCCEFNSIYLGMQNCAGATFFLPTQNQAPFRIHCSAPLHWQSLISIRYFHHGPSPKICHAHTICLYRRPLVSGATRYFFVAGPGRMRSVYFTLWSTSFLAVMFRCSKIPTIRSSITRTTVDPSLSNVLICGNLLFTWSFLVAARL